jgi:hypothetical protein
MEGPLYCPCGCGQAVTYWDFDAKRPMFKPGHDQRLRVALEKRVGGIDGFRELVESVERFNQGFSSAETLTKSIYELFTKHGLYQEEISRVMGS